MSATSTCPLPWCATHDTYPDADPCVTVHWSPQWSPAQIDTNRMLQLTRFDAPDEPGEVRILLSGHANEALSPDEARNFAAWLLEVADLADQIT